MAAKCKHIKEDGNRCDSYVITGSDYCFSHDPERSEEKIAAVTKGGLQIKRPRVCGDNIRITKARDVMMLLARCINEVRQGQLSPKEANAVGYLANILLGAIKETDIETKIEEVQNALKIRNENR